MTTEFNLCVEYYKQYVIGSKVNELATTLGTESPYKKGFKRIWYIFKSGFFEIFDLTEMQFKQFIEFHNSNFKTIEKKEEEIR